MTEPVYYEDVQDQEEEVLNVWKMAHDLYKRLAEQQINPVLLAQVTELVNLLAAAHGKVQEIQASWDFPKM